jgi:REP element-mobilizing transposase RayT
MSTAEWELHKGKLRFARHDDWLDRRPAVRHLADQRLARVVRDAVYHFAGRRYDLLGYVVMPSHLHWVFRPRGEWEAALGKAADERSPRERIMHSLKRHTALECNRLLGRDGVFWQDESYDHCPRDGDELERILNYIEWNPVKAGLVSTPEGWPFSSARDRRDWALELGQPLLRPL